MWFYGFVGLLGMSWALLCNNRRKARQAAKKFDQFISTHPLPEPQIPTGNNSCVKLEVTAIPVDKGAQFHIILRSDTKQDIYPVNGSPNRYLSASESRKIEQLPAGSTFSSFHLEDYSVFHRYRPPTDSFFLWMYCPTNLTTEANRRITVR